jgi:hypothetical protein
MKRLGALLATVGVLVVSPAMAAIASADPPNDSVVGAVTLLSENQGLTVTTEIRAFSDPDGSNPSGFFALETTGASAGTGSFRGHVTCLRISGNHATVGFVIDRATGAASGLVGMPDVVYITDNGVPVHGQPPDLEDVNPGTGYDGGPTCPPILTNQTKLSVMRGNLTVTAA